MMPREMSIAGLAKRPLINVPPVRVRRPLITVPGVNPEVPLITAPGVNEPLDLSTPLTERRFGTSYQIPKKFGVNGPLHTYIGEQAKGWREYPGVETPEGGYVPEGAFTRLADKKVRKEISDEGADIKIPLKLEGYEGKVGDWLNHPELIRNYPEFSDMNLKIGRHKGDSASGAYDPKSNTIGIDHELMDVSKLSTGLHELQHAIQEKEGFAKGGSPSEFIDKNLDSKLMDYQRELFDPSTKPRRKAELNEIIKSYKENRNKNIFDDYQRLAGEVESRDVQARMNMPMSQRVKSQPYQSQGIPVNRQIVRYGGGKAENTIRPRKVSRVKISSK